MAAKRTAPPPLFEALLVDYLKQGAVSELVVVEETPGVYRLEALLTWRTERSVLFAARGDVRRWHRLDTLARFFRSVGVGRTAIRLELLV
jgi:hypothetical protein